MAVGRFADRVAFVTGAGSGIGRATARRLAVEGAAVACVDLDATALRETVDAIEGEGGRARALECDVADAGLVAAAVAAALEAFGALHAVFNVAGLFRSGHTEGFDPAEWDRMLAVNLTGPFLVSRAALPHLLEQRRASITNVASVAGLNGQAYTAAYCASKAGVVGLTKALAVEYARRGLRVNCVCPAGVTTPLLGRAAPPEDADPDLVARWGLVPKLTRPEEVAEALAWLASDAARSVNGVALPIDFGNTAA